MPEAQLGSEELVRAHSQAAGKAGIELLSNGNEKPFADAEMDDQADVLTPIAPVLSARSDSFIIRGYGEAINAAGKVTARAYCEAIVERGSQYTDQVDQPELRFPELSSEVNQRFGRKFRIMSFQWIQPQEI